jgi:hypothetical protein
LVRSETQKLAQIIDIPALLADLSALRPVFHSEADFQYAFAQLLAQRQSACSVRLERPIRVLGNAAVDIWVGTPDGTAAIELKYLTRKASGEAHGEQFNLKNHSAHDVRRYDVLKDVSRMEKMRATEVDYAAVVALTNDPAYWAGPKRAGTNDADFSIQEGRVVSGALAWSEATGAGSMKNREAPLNLEGRYEIAWRDYGAADKSFGLFRYLMIECGDAPAHR